MYSQIEYNQETSLNHDLLIKERIKIPTAEEKVNTVNLAKRDGEDYKGTGVYKDIAIMVKFNFRSPPDKWMDVLRESKQWLFGMGNRKLKLPDDPGWFYKVKNVKISTTERTMKKIGTFAVTFTCYPHQYRHDCEMPISPKWNETVLATPQGVPLLTVDGKTLVTSYQESMLYNQYAESHPIYRITGNGEGALYVNGNAVKLKVEGDLIIDTERMVSYKEDGIIENTSITGDYDWLYLAEGENQIRLSQNLELKIMPMWRCL